MIFKAIVAWTGEDQRTTAVYSVEVDADTSEEAALIVHGRIRAEHGGSTYIGKTPQVMGTRDFKDNLMVSPPRPIPRDLIGWNRLH